MNDADYATLNVQLSQLITRLECAISTDMPDATHIRYLARLTYNAATNLGYELIARNALDTLDAYNATN